MIKLLYRVRWVLIIGLLFFSSAFADESSCPAIQQMNPEAQARKYCETFFSYNYDKTPEIRETGLACVNLYKRVVQNVQEICLYVKEGRALREKEPEIGRAHV